MGSINDRFLSVHPATLLWWEQREQCRTCSHMIYNPLSMPVKEMRCYAAPCKLAPSPPRGRHVQAYCIDARLPGGCCGPEATLYEPLDDEDE